MKKLKIYVSICFAVMLCLAVGMTISAKAEKVKYMEASWDRANNITTYTEKEAEAEIVTNSTKTLCDGGWYVAVGKLKYTGSLEVKGTVHLIIADDAKLTVDRGIYCNDAVLNIYGQEKGNGIIDAKGQGESSGIGSIMLSAGDPLTEARSNKVARPCFINIHGGNIKATGGKNGSGIGEFYYNSRIDISIYGGNVTAKGGFNKAGIGATGISSNIYIYGGNITATGGQNGAGIGGGAFGECAHVYIYGGSVTATGGNGGAGIGGGLQGNGGYIRIYGGKVTAAGGQNGAGIGGGELGNGGMVVIYGGTVTADGDESAEGIGRGAFGRQESGTFGIVGNLEVFGGDNKDSMIARTDFAENRWRYMSVLQSDISQPYLPDSVDRPSVSITKAVNTGKKIEIAWKKIKGAKGYDLFVTYCGAKLPKKATFSVRKNKISFSKLNKKALKQNKCVKYVIKAYKKVNGKKKYISSAYSGHIPGVKLTKYTNVRKITVRNSSVTLKVGKTSKIKASVVKYKTGKKLVNHVSRLRYKSSNISIATVTGSGKIRAVAKGTCTIYVYSTSGLTKEVKVTVK